MRVKTAILVALFILVTVSCTTASVVPTDVGEAACGAPDYGIITDENFKIVALASGGAAEKAGLQVGDVLVAATWVKLDLSYSCHDVFYVDANGSPLPTPEYVTDPAQIVEPQHPSGAVLFTEQANIDAILSYRPIIKLQFRRGEQMIEVVITPSFVTFNYPPGDQKNTPTPVPASYHYF